MDEKDNARLGLLIMELARGNCAVLEEIAQFIEKILYAIGNTYFKNKADVEDAIQNLYIKLYHKASRFRKNSNACSWIIKLYTNLIKSHLRKYKRDAKHIGEMEVFEKERAVMDERYIENHVFLTEILSSLTKYERELVQWYYWCGFSIREVAEKMHKSKGSIENDLKKLKEKIEREK